MSILDWATLSDNASSSSIVVSPVTSAVVPLPNGASNFVLAAHSLTNAAGAVGYYSGLTGFSPMAKTGDISGAVYKGGAGGSLHSEFLFVALDGQASTNHGYLLGLSAADPCHIVLVKGQLAYGIPDVAPGSQGVLRRSAATFAKGTWVHLKLEAILQPNGDVVLTCYQSDLSANLVTAPSWSAIPGMAAFTDDNAQINTGSAPLTSGRVGFGMVSAEINRIGAWAEVTTDRQVLP